MSGLLDFALGFGQGAAGAVAYDRKSQLDMQRQANLDRLRAQYATEQKTAEVDRITGLIGDARGGNQESADRLMAKGVNLAGTQESSKMKNYINPDTGDSFRLDENNPEHRRRIADEGLIGAADASLSDPAPTLNPYINIRTGERKTLDERNPEHVEMILSDEWLQTTRYEEKGGWTEHVDSSGRRWRTHNVDERTQLFDRAGNWVDVGGPNTRGQTPSELSGFSADPGFSSMTERGDSRVDQMRRVNPIGNAPGVGPGARAAFGRMWLVGDALSAYTGARDGENFATDQQQAQYMIRTLNNSIRAAAARNIQDGGERVSNLMLELTESETLQFSMFNSESGLRERLASAEAEMSNKYQEELRIFNSPATSESRSKQAEAYLSNFGTIIRDMNIMLNVHKASSTLIDNQRIIEMPRSEIASIIDRAHAGELTLNNEQLDALGAYLALEEIDKYMRDQRNP